MQNKDQAEKILKELTLDEKIGMIHGAQLFQTAGVERLGIPPMKFSDGPMGVRQEFEPDSWATIDHTDDYVTYMPCISALAATWNRDLSYEMGNVLGEEFRGRGKDMLLGPGVNIKRSPLCGRNFEYFSEDPYLTGEMAVPYIKGVQNWDVAACVKHFAVNNQETERLWVNVEIDEKVLRKIYLKAFYDVVKKGGAYAIMGAYNKIRNEHCCQSDFLLKDILRDEWNYDGVVVSDWGAVHDTEKAANSQLDIEMSVTNDFDDYFMADPLKKKIEAGEIDEKVVDEKVLRILNLMIKLHMLDGKRKSGAYNTPEHREKALKIAEESVVLLKNEEKILPLQKDKLKKVLLVGRNAEQIHSNNGGSAEIKALYEITPLMGLKTHLGGNVQVDYVAGYDKDVKKEESDKNWQETSLENGGGSVKEQTENEEILKRRKELLKIKPDMPVVLIGGTPVEMGEWIDQAKAVVWGWYAGMEGGTAMAEVLLGEVNPSGKLPESFYKTITDCSAHSLGEFPGDENVRYSEGMYVGYRYLDKYEIEPQFCFGHGLSYTTFEYENLALDRTDPDYKITFTLKNTGDRDGSEIVQVYVHKETEPDIVKELAGFEKVSLKAGEEKQVTVKVAADNGFSCKFFVGSSSRDLRLMD
jgi:beta-glucosidase